MKLTKKAIEEKMEEDADREYQTVAYDLPRQGRFHYQSAIDHIADRLCERFYEHRSNVSFRSVATQVVKRYCSNDTAESNRNEKQMERRWKKAQEPRIKKSASLRIPSWDSKKPTRLGTGSY